ncbi:hypothetical protein ACSIGC_14530 [Tenacibaculum sp. ZS6-P6]|uniref:hypothetical protein n=1 Tax=Tenacibaculum sp. ZS6-P6 TaxID=3447503 RepID=UPI003F9E48BF
MDTITKKTWYSGDWKQRNNDQIPYNGIKIEATASYNDSNKLDTVTAILTDYTKDPNGISNTVQLNKTNIWYDIPIPIDETIEPPQLNTKFTIEGIYLNGDLGKLQLCRMTTGIYLRVQFRYGEQYRTREELGFILQFDESISL